jgi:hypothetical protein
VPMNFVLGGSVLAALSRVRARRDARHARLTAWFARALPVGFAAAVTGGVAALLFLQVLYGRLFFTSSILMAWWWMAVIPLLILAYYAAYVLASRPDAGGVVRRAAAWGIVLATLAVAFIYANNMSLMLRPEGFVARYRADARGLQLNLLDPTLAPRLLHVTLGAVAVTGMVLAFVGHGRRRADAAYGAWLLGYGARWFVAATAANVVAGVWWLVALPPEIVIGSMGQAVALMAVLAGGILLGLAAFSLMIMAIPAAWPGSLLRAAAGALAAGLVLMITTRDLVRRGLLEAAGFQPVNWVSSQWGPIAIFAVLLLAGVGTVIWMVVSLLRAAPSAEVRSRAGV